MAREIGKKDRVLFLVIQQPSEKSYAVGNKISVTFADNLFCHLTIGWRRIFYVNCNCSLFAGAIKHQPNDPSRQQQLAKEATKKGVNLVYEVTKFAHILSYLCCSNSNLVIRQ